MGDYVFHGYYCGAQGSGETRPPIDETDAACQEHDVMYGVLGKPAYYKFNWADQRFLQRLSKIKPKSYKEAVARRVAIDFFKTKRAVAPYYKGSREMLAALFNPYVLGSVMAGSYAVKEGIVRRKRTYAPRKRKFESLPSNTPGPKRSSGGLIPLPAIAPPKDQGMLAPIAPRYGTVPHGKYIRSSRKRRRRKKKASVSKVVRKYVKRTLQNDKFFVRIYQQQDTTFQSKSCALNKVAWSIMIDNTRASYVANLTGAYRQVGENTSNVQRIEAIDLEDYTNIAADSGQVYYGKKFQFLESYSLLMANNTNHAANLCFYLVQCIDDTSLSPLDELDERLKTAYNTASVTAKEDLPNQYLSTPNKKSKKWKLKKKWTYHLSGGNHSKLHLKLPRWVFDPDHVAETAEGETYCKGVSILLCRIQGDLAHDDTTETIVGMGKALVDVKLTKYIQISTQAGNKAYIDRAPSATFGSLAAAVQADHDGVNVGVYAD